MGPFLFRAQIWYVERMKFSDLTVLYDDADVLAIDKPAGVVVHPDAHHANGTVLDAVRTKYPRAALLHRLDKDTSGVLLIAKDETSPAFVYFKSLFHDHKITKTYAVLVSGVMTKDTGVIDLPIGRSTSDPRKRATLGKKGKSRAAVTVFTVKERLENGGATLLEVRPRTGRTHQIRSHLTSIGHPVVCDALYGGKRYFCPPHLSRQFLHASELVFTTDRGSRVSIASPLPKDLSRALKELRS